MSEYLDVIEKAKSKRGRKRKDPDTKKSLAHRRRRYQGHWSFKERRQLLAALRECPTEEEIDRVYRKIPTKSKDEIDAELLRLKNSCVRQGPDLKAPIETWIDFVEELMYFETEDHSETLARTMSMVANYDTFPTPSVDAPNYKQLYKYIAAVLNGEEPPVLSSMDSTIMLDLMHSLADVLSSADVEVAKKVLQWKFSMLNCKVDINNVVDSAARVRKAMFNEFPAEFGLNSSGYPSSPENPSTSTSTTSNTDGNTPLSSGEVTGDNPGKINPTPMQTEEMNCDNSGKTSSRTSLPSGEVNSENSGETTSTSNPPKKRRGRLPTKDSIVLEKPMLYTLNPFCVPIGVLKLKKKKSKVKTRNR